MRFEGVLTALVTPMHSDESIDREALVNLVERQIDAGVDGIVPCGTTGETPTLSDEEQAEIIALVVKTVRGRVKVVAGAGANSTAHACDLTRAAADAGADATLQVTPYYNKPTQAGLVAHFTRIADATELPVLLYNIPGRCGLRIECETLARLAAHPRILAVKDATGDLNFVAKVRIAAPELTVMSGDDALTLPMMALGATGVVSVASNVAPQAMVEMVHCMAKGDAEHARRLHERLMPLMNALFLETNPIPVKAALVELGLVGSTMRLPMTPATKATSAVLRAALAALELGVSSSG